jgi:hypothetical protein
MPSMSEMMPGAMALAGVSLLLVILLRKYFRYQGKLKLQARREARQAAKPGTGQRSKQEAPPEVKRWEVEFHETSRDLQAELDTKMRALQILIHEADAAAERVEQAKREM